MLEHQETQLPAQEVLSSTEETQAERTDWAWIWEQIVKAGFAGIFIRVATLALLVVMALVVTWVMDRFYVAGQGISSQQVLAAKPDPTPTIAVMMPAYDVSLLAAADESVLRNSVLQTNRPARPRYDVLVYEVMPGDTIFGIAQKFNLRPETILWGNYNVLADDPHRLRPGQKLNILPMNGVYYEWHAGDGLNGVAEFFGVTADDIVDFPGNRLNRQTLGDYANPNIQPGTWLVVPGGRREFITWSAPRITRDNPAVAKVLGPGSCEGAWDGPVGIGTFIWPTAQHTLSGFDYSPETNHYGIDLGGYTGAAIYAVDNGVVVYAGWNDWGYGNMVVIDHGGDWQSLYAHLSAWNVTCGAGVYQGDVIGAMGSTGNSSGPHLHFELRIGSSRVNPWSFLPK